MRAYHEMYLEDAMQRLAQMLDYLVNTLGYEGNHIFEIFARSDIGSNFEKGNPAYVAGRSGVELAWMLLDEIQGKHPDTPYEAREDSKEYWIGWVYAYYQWYRGFRFRDLISHGLNVETVRANYILHEADLAKFVDVADVLMEVSIPSKENMLKRLRAYCNMTQKQLSEKSGVTLRMIQLYEQGRNALPKAQASVVLSLAKALECDVETLLSS